MSATLGATIHMIKGSDLHVYRKWLLKNCLQMFQYFDVK